MSTPSFFLSGKQATVCFPMVAHARALERETECWNAGEEPVAWGYQKGRIDVCWLGPGRNSVWWNRWRKVTSATIKT